MSLRKGLHAAEQAGQRPSLSCFSGWAKCPFAMPMLLHSAASLHDVCLIARELQLSLHCCLRQVSHPTLQEALAKHASGAISNHPLKLRDMLKEWQERCKETAKEEPVAA